MARKASVEKQKKHQKFSSRNYNRCGMCGRPRAYMRKWGICRLCFFKYSKKGKLPGVTKSSW